MTAPLKKKKAQPKSRSQAERSTDTRDRIIQAAVEIITKSGFKKASMGQIAATAGVTTGAIQHHFGDKAGILFEVIEMSFSQLATQFSETIIKNETLEDRVGQFIEILWDKYQTPLFWTCLEIIMNMKDDDSFTGRVKKRIDYINLFIDRMWMGTFWDAPVPREYHVAAQRFLFNFINGLAIEKLASTANRDTTTSFILLKTLIMQLLGENPPVHLIQSPTEYIKD